MMNKKRVSILIIVLIMIFAVVAGASSPADTSAWILLPNTAIYKEASFDSESLHVCEINDEVKLIGDKFTENDVVWQKVIYNDKITGYVPYDLLYFSNASTENLKMVKITPDKMGQTVPLYKVLTDDPALQLTDGTHVTLLKTSADYGEYSLVEYEGQKYFVKTVNVTDMLTYNQKIAIIIAASLLGVIICAISVILIYRKRMQNK